MEGLYKWYLRQNSSQIIHLNSDPCLCNAQLYTDVFIYWRYRFRTNRPLVTGFSLSPLRSLIGFIYMLYLQK